MSLHCLLSIVMMGFATTVTAGTIISVTGPVSPLAEGVLSPNNILAVDWTQTNTYSSVTISAPFLSLGAQTGQSVDAYLMSAIGAGTTAAQEISTASIIVPSNLSQSGFSFITLFSGLTLAPGHYYLVVAPSASTVNQIAWDAIGGPPSNAVVTTDSGVTSDPNQLVSNTFFGGLNTAFPPASFFEQVQPLDSGHLNLQFNVASVPEPGSVLLILSGLAIIGVKWSRKKLVSF